MPAWASASHSKTKQTGSALAYFFQMMHQSFPLPVMGGGNYLWLVVKGSWLEVRSKKEEGSKRSEVLGLKSEV